MAAFTSLVEVDADNAWHEIAADNAGRAVYIQLYALTGGAAGVLIAAADAAGDLPDGDPDPLMGHRLTKNDQQLTLATSTKLFAWALSAPVKLVVTLAQA